MSSFLKVTKSCYFRGLESFKSYIYYRDMVNIVDATKGERSEEGIAEGRQSALIVVAKSLTAEGRSNENLVRITGLSIDERGVNVS